jgi:hypothetical protein
MLIENTNYTPSKTAPSTLENLISLDTSFSISTQFPPTYSPELSLFTLNNLEAVIYEPDRTIFGVPVTELERLGLALSELSYQDGALVHPHNIPDPDAFTASLIILIQLRAKQLLNKAVSANDIFELSVSSKYYDFCSDNNLKPIEVYTSGVVKEWMLESATNLNINVIKLENVEESKAKEVLSRPYCLVDISDYNVYKAFGSFHKSSLPPSIIIDHHIALNPFPHESKVFSYLEGPNCSSNIALGSLYLMLNELEIGINSNSPLGRFISLGAIVANATDNCMSLGNIDENYLPPEELDISEYHSGLNGLKNLFEFDSEDFERRLKMVSEADFSINLAVKAAEEETEDSKSCLSFYSPEMVEDPDFLKQYTFPTSKLALAVIFKFMPYLSDEEKSLISESISVESSPYYPKALYSVHTTMNYFMVNDKIEVILANAGKLEGEDILGGLANDTIRLLYQSQEKNFNNSFDSEKPQVLILVGKIGDRCQISLRLTPEAEAEGLEASLLCRAITQGCGGGDSRRGAGRLEESFQKTKDTDLAYKCIHQDYPPIVQQTLKKIIFNLKKMI